jgi:hypothetical protein
MSNRKDALMQLLANVKAGHGNDPSDYLCLMIVNNSIAARNAYNGSMDAARELHEAVLPDWYVDEMGNNSKSMGWTIRIFNAEGNYKVGIGFDNPARAWLIAIIQALILIENNNEKEIL